MKFPTHQSRPLLSLMLLAMLSLLLPAAVTGNANDRFPMSEVSSEELLRYAEQRLERPDHLESLAEAAAALRRRVESGLSPYLVANSERVDTVLFTTDLRLMRQHLERNLYSYQQNPEQLIADLRRTHPEQDRVMQLPDADLLRGLSQENSTLALYLLAVFGAYDLSLGEWDQAIRTLELYRQLPAGARDQDIRRYEELLQGLQSAVRRYDYAQQRLPVPEVFFAITGFGMAAVSAADILNPDFQIPFFPGNSRARTTALSGTVVGGSLIGISGIILPSLLRTSPLEPMIEYLSDSWGHLIDGALQIFEDNRHRPNQLIILTLTENRFVVFPGSSEPRELPGVFAVTQPGRIRIQVLRGLERITTPTTVLHPGINIISLNE